MSTVRRGDIVRALSERVNARVRGRGVSREAVADAVERVVDVLEGRGDLAGADENAELVAVLSSDRMPDLASRLRRDLQAEGVVILRDGQGLVGTAYRRDASAPVRSEVRAGTARCAASGIGIICLAEAGSP